MDRLDLERDDRIQDERDESLKPVYRMNMEEIREEYDLKIEYYGLKDSSIEFNERVEELAKYMRIDSLNPDFEKITPEIRESCVSFLSEKIEKSIECANLLNEGITIRDYFEKDIDMHASTIKVIGENGRTINLDSITMRLDLKKDFFEEKYSINGSNISPEEPLSKYFKEGVRFESCSREEIIDKCYDRHRALETVLVDKYSRADSAKIEREPYEGLFDSLMKMYEAKGLRDPNLKYSLEHYDDRSSFDDNSKTYVSAFIKSLTPEEKISLIPRNGSETRDILYGRGDYYSYTKIDDLYRPIYGYANLNHEMMDRLADSLQGSRCVEFGCGNGILSRMLQDRGVDVTPVDIGGIKDNHYGTLKNNIPATEITYMDARDYLRQNDEKIDYVILSWPPYDNPMASDICELLLEKSPDTQIVYIGEGSGGCTADDRFFELTEFAMDQKGIDEADEQHISFGGIHDYIELRDLVVN